ncbi:glycosyl transferase [Psychromonas marina]|uniref:Glycosyl transferase n=1 Tax=Psychromonas marina TaxID=88364 RepID=A0ABQ6E1F8_9GAMM|nr:glycosyltransferase family 4 protein [Psychromonas marina]GLS91282.1 glycosyl transferase [Psychromonas marina]
MNNETKQSAKTILFTHYGDNWIRGSERCLLDLITHLDKQQFNAVLWCNQPLMAEEAKALNIEVYCSDFPLLLGWTAPRFDLFAFAGLIKQATQLIKNHNISLIHANSAAPCQWLTFAAKKNKIPLICHMHTSYQLRDRLTLGLYQTDMVVGVSDYVVAPLRKDNKPDTQINVISNGIDTQRLLAQPVVSLRESLGINAGDFVIASVGSLIARKGFDLLIEAVALLIEKEISVHLLLIGSGPEYGNLKVQSKKRGIQQHISFLGECENPVGLLRGNADIFVSTAREEAFGLVLAEASLAGLAVVAPDTGGVRDVVIDQQTGTLVATENVDAVVGAIEHLYFQPRLCFEMGKAGQQHVLNNFTIEQNTHKFQSLYHQQLSTATHKQAWYKSVALRWDLITSYCSALKNFYQNSTKKGLIHER